MTDILRMTLGKYCPEWFFKNCILLQMFEYFFTYIFVRSDINYLSGYMYNSLETPPSSFRPEKTTHVPSAALDIFD